MIELSRLSVEVVTKQQRPSIPLAPPLSLYFPLYFPLSSLRAKELQYWMKRNIKSLESLTRDRQKGAISTKCAGKKWSLLERELDNIQELLRQLEAERQAQRRVKQGRLARADKDG